MGSEMGAAASRRGGRRRASASSGSLPETQPTEGLAPWVTAPSNSPAAYSVPEEPSSRSASPSPVRSLHLATGPSRRAHTKASELLELEELRRKNMRLERDLYESLQALEEESISSTSSPSHSPAVSPSGGNKDLAGSLDRAAAICSFEEVGPTMRSEPAQPRSCSTNSGCGSNFAGNSCASRPSTGAAQPDGSAPSHTNSRLPRGDLSAKEVASSWTRSGAGGSAVPAGQAEESTHSKHTRQATAPKFEHGRRASAPGDAEAALHPNSVFHDSDCLASFFAPSSK